MFTTPAENSSDVMKLINPIIMVDTDHMGDQLSGWKSDIDVHILCSVSKRPDVVCMIIDGGANGYVRGKRSSP